MSDKEQKQSISLDEFMRIQGIDDRNKFAASRIFKNSNTLSVKEWTDCFKKHKLITQ